MGGRELDPFTIQHLRLWRWQWQWKRRYWLMMMMMMHSTHCHLLAIPEFTHHLNPFNENHCDYG